jgi:hypothetical protein
MPPGAILVKKTAENRPNTRFSMREEKKPAQIAAICTSEPSPQLLSRMAKRDRRSHATPFPKKAWGPAHFGGKADAGALRAVSVGEAAAAAV